MSRFSGDLKQISNEFKTLSIQLSELSKELSDKSKEKVLHLETLKEVEDFARKNFDNNIANILKTLNEELLPKIFRYELYRAIVKSKEFNVKEYHSFVSSVNINSSLIKAVYNKKNKNITLRLNEKKLSLASYANAVIRARESLGVSKKTSAKTASKYWKLYYQAAREGQRIIIERKGETKNKTYAYAQKYWRMVKARISFFPPDTIPFYHILELGTENVSLLSDRGGTPYPIVSSYEILANVNKELLNWLKNLQKSYIDYLKEDFLNINVEIPQDINQIEMLTKIVTDLVEKGVKLKIPSRIYRDAELLEQRLEKEIQTYFYKLGYKNIKVNIIKTRTNIFTLIARAADGKFVKWRL